MTDTPESVRKLIGDAMFGKEVNPWAPLHRYADLLERIGKAPKVTVTEKAYWMQSLESVTGKTVALVEVE